MTFRCRTTPCEGRARPTRIRWPELCLRPRWRGANSPKVARRLPKATARARRAPARSGVLRRASGRAAARRGPAPA